MKLTEQTISLLQEARDGRDLGIICIMTKSDPPEEVRKNRLCQLLVSVKLLNEFKPGFFQLTHKGAIELSNALLTNSAAPSASA